MYVVVVGFIADIWVVIGIIGVVVFVAVTVATVVTMGAIVVNSDSQMRNDLVVTDGSSQKRIYPVVAGCRVRKLRIPQGLLRKVGQMLGPMFNFCADVSSLNDVEILGRTHLSVYKAFG